MVVMARAGKAALAQVLQWKLYRGWSQQDLPTQPGARPHHEAALRLVPSSRLHTRLRYRLAHPQPRSSLQARPANLQRPGGRNRLCAMGHARDIPKTQVAESDAFSAPTVSRLTYRVERISRLHSIRLRPAKWSKPWSIPSARTNSHRPKDPGIRRKCR